MTCQCRSIILVYTCLFLYYVGVVIVTFASYPLLLILVSCSSGMALNPLFLLFPLEQTVEQGFAALAVMAQCWEASEPEEQSETSNVWGSGRATIATALSELLQQAWLRPAQQVVRSEHLLYDMFLVFIYEYEMFVKKRSVLNRVHMYCFISNTSSYLFI